MVGKSRFPTVAGRNAVFSHHLSTFPLFLLDTVGLYGTRFFDFHIRVFPLPCIREDSKYTYLPNRELLPFRHKSFHSSPVPLHLCWVPSSHESCGRTQQRWILVVSMWPYLQEPMEKDGGEDLETPQSQEVGNEGEAGPDGYRASRTTAKTTCKSDQKSD